MRFWRALLRALLQSIGALAATTATWAAWLVWFVFLNGHHDPEWGGPWGTFRFGMLIALRVALILCGIFAVLSLILHLCLPRIERQRLLLSSLTLTLTSLFLLPVLPGGGAPLIAVMIGLPLVAALWMVGGRGRSKNDHGQSPASSGAQEARTHV
jgi:hypothetical protein